MPRRKKVIEEEHVPEIPDAPEEEAAVPPPTAPEDIPLGLRLSEEERRAAALAHGSILLNLVTGLGGPVVALVIWLLYERKSDFVGWHALQSLVFQVVVLLLTALVGAISVVLWLFTALLSPILVGFCLVPFALGFSFITLALLVGSLIYGCAGALRVLQGQDFRYRWVSEWIGK